MTIEHLGRVARRRAAIVAVASLALACGESGPCPGVEEGLQVEIEVQGLNEDSQSQVNCYEGWGFASGASLAATVVQLKGEHSCRSGVPEVKGPGNWTWELDTRTTPPGGRSLYGEYTISRDGCSAWLTMELATNDGPDCDAAAGDLCRLYINVSPRKGLGGDCPDFCGFVLDVRAHTL